MLLFNRISFLTKYASFHWFADGKYTNLKIYTFSLLPLLNLGCDCGEDVTAEVGGGHLLEYHGSLEMRELLLK